MDQEEAGQHIEGPIFRCSAISLMTFAEATSAPP